jgi:hypothetical protein
MTELVTSLQPATITAPRSPQEIAAQLPGVISGARWFWWIAGLSVVNIVLFQVGSETSFVVGLGMTAVSDAIFSQLKIVGFAIDAIILGFFALMGLQAQRGKLWAFYVGTIVYMLDAFVYAAVDDWMSVAFHCLALFYLVKSALALRVALKSEN